MYFNLRYDVDWAHDGQTPHLTHHRPTPKRNKLFYFIYLNFKAFIII